MSYRNPKYTYVSQQPAFSQMQQDITGAAKTIADKKAKALEAEKKKGELISKLSSTASAKHVRDTLGASPDDFTDYGRGVVENYFKGSGKKVGELTIATQGPNAKCKVDGNCEELQLELAKLQEKPKQVKSMLETLVSELDWQSIENFDESQNPELMAVSSIMQGIGEFAKEPYGYEMRDGAGGSIDIVFKGPESMFPGDDNNNPGEYIINSKELEAATGPGGASLFNNTQSASVNQGNVMKESMKCAKTVAWNLLSKQQKNLSKLIKKIDRKIANQTKSKFTNKQINIIKKLYNSDKSYNKHKSGRLYRYTQKSKYNKNKKGRLYRYTRKSKHK